MQSPNITFDSLKSACIGCLLLTGGLWGTVRGGQIVYPWRATTAIVKAGVHVDAAAHSTRKVDILPDPRHPPS